MKADSHIHLDKMNENSRLSHLNNMGCLYVSAGTNSMNSKINSVLAAQYDNVYAVAGIHPLDVKKEGSFDALSDIIRENSKVIAVGETGLDYRDKENMELQREVFEKHLLLAMKFGKPVILHTVRAMEDVISFMKKYSSIRYIMHGYTFGKDITKRLLEFDTYFGIGKAITYENPRKLVESLSLIPAQRLLAETDDPDLDGEADIQNIDEVISALSFRLKMDSKDIEELTYRNTLEAFGIKL